MFWLVLEHKQKSKLKLKQPFNIAIKSILKIFKIF